jgi:hypothetical protein
MVIKAVFAALLLLALLTSKCAYDHNRRLEGRNNLLQQQNAQLQDTLRKHVRLRDTLYLRDTLTKWRTIRETVSLLDTLRLSDTVTLTRRESVVVFAADSAIQACRSIVASCETRIGVRDSLIRAITWERDHWKRKSQPSLLTRISTAGKWLAVGYLIGITR